MCVYSRHNEGTALGSLEEGETDDELFDALLKMRSNSYFEDAFAFVRVDFV